MLAPSQLTYLQEKEPDPAKCSGLTPFHVISRLRKEPELAKRGVLAPFHLSFF
jgi:hypothetical protein